MLWSPVWPDIFSIFASLAGLPPPSPYRHIKADPFLSLFACTGYSASFHRHNPLLSTFDFDEPFPSLPGGVLYTHELSTPKGTAAAYRFYNSDCSPSHHSTSISQPSSPFVGFGAGSWHVLDLTSVFRVSIGFSVSYDAHACVCEDVRPSSGLGKSGPSPPCSWLPLRSSVVRLVMNIASPDHPPVLGVKGRFPRIVGLSSRFQAPPPPLVEALPRGPGGPRTGFLTPRSPPQTLC